MMTGQNDGTGGKEQQRLEKRMRHQMEHRATPGTNPQRQEHVTDLTHGGIGQDTFDIGLNQCGKTGKQQRYCADNTDQIQHIRRHQKEAMHAGDQIDPGSYHGSGMDQRRDRCRTRHGIGQPGLQWQLSRFTYRTTQQHQRGKFDGGITGGQFLRG